jgi:phospholipid/cholesterol/gamma-HCH transport system substrate-binding protein
MENRAPSPRLLILPVGFALLCIVLTMIVYASFGGALPFTPDGYRLTVPLTSASNLVQGSNVEVAGVTIGKVVNVRRNGNGALATLQIQPPYTPLHVQARAIARTKTLLGEAFIEIAPGPRSAAPIPDGGRLASSHVLRQVQLDQFLQTFGPRTRQRMRQLFSGLSTALAGQGQALNNSLGWAAPLSSNLDDVLRTVDGQRADVQGLIASSANVMQAIGSRQGVLRSAVTAGNDVLTVTAQRNRALAAVVRATAPFLGQLRATSNTISADSPTLNAAVRELLPVAPLVAPAIGEITSAAPQFRSLFRGLPATIRAGDHGLPALSAMITSAQTAFHQFYPTSRQLIPIIQLMAADPTVPAAPFADVANLTGGVFAGPGGMVQHYATGLPTVWNETVGGWVKRLPTNILNPYVKPGGQLDIARLGYIKSFDCRNIHNPLFLPALGTGSPPCVQQGPWTFNGKSAFYPRLTEAPP